jgi:hypothetical protein
MLWYGHGLLFRGPLCAYLCFKIQDTADGTDKFIDGCCVSDCCNQRLEDHLRTAGNEGDRKLCKGWVS